MICGFYMITASVMIGLRVDSHLPIKLLLFTSMESPLKVMKNAFYFILKALFVLKIFKFLWWLFGHVGKTAWLGRKDKFKNSWRHNLVSKQLQYIYSLIPHKLETSQRIEVGQLIEYSKKNVFLQKSCKTWGRETSCRPLFVF